MNEDDEYRRFIESQMRHRMDVYTTTGSSTGRYDTPVAFDQPCLLSKLGAGRAATVSDRTQMMRIRVLTFRVDFEMPVRARVLIDGRRWQVSADTIEVQEGPLGTGIAKTCDIASADRPTA